MRRREKRSQMPVRFAGVGKAGGVFGGFDDDGVQRVAEVAGKVKGSTENIGARRLHTVMERLLETVSFESGDRSGDHVTIDREYVDKHLEKLAGDEDLSRYIL